MVKETCGVGVLIGVALGVGVLGCSDSPGVNGLPITSGGVVASGGLVVTGGAAETGGLIAGTGGLVAGTGGEIATGGTGVTGGSVDGTGGDAATGGTGVTGGSVEGTGGMEEQDMGGTAALPPLADDKVLPIVFVHGFAGSAQQYESQAQRFVANGFPQDYIYAYDHDGAGFDTASFQDGLDEMVDRALSETGKSQVFLVGHSRGTFVSSSYLGDHADKVAKYVALDGSGCGFLSTPCIAPNQAGLNGQTHVEVATSAESFVMQYEFLIGGAPQVVDIVRQPSPVTISGRAVDFPANTGKDGTTLAVYEIDPATGHRLSDTAVATVVLDGTGDWGPVEVDSRKYYELVLTTQGANSHHFYLQRFLRDSHLVRLLSGQPDADSRLNTNSGPGHAAIVASRMREWSQADTLNVSTSSPGAGDEAAVNVITSGTGDANIAIHLHDDADSPGQSSLDVLDWFGDQPFQSGTDIYMPATDPPDGTITLQNMPRGDTTTPQTINVPNWASEGHTISVVFADYPQPVD